MDPVDILSTTGTPSQLHQIKNGAMVIIKDHGAMYRLWKDRGIFRTWSEHSSLERVYDVPGAVGNVLMGLTFEGHSWFQWERSKCCSCTHCIDWLKFIWTSQNQGPYGQSKHTEKNPIVFDSLKFKRNHSLKF